MEAADNREFTRNTHYCQLRRALEVGGCRQDLGEWAAGSQRQMDSASSRTTVSILLTCDVLTTRPVLDDIVGAREARAWRTAQAAQQPGAARVVRVRGTVGVQPAPTAGDMSKSETHFSTDCG